MTDKYYYSLNFANFGEISTMGRYESLYGWYDASLVEEDQRGILITILLQKHDEEPFHIEGDSALLFYKNIMAAIKDKDKIRAIFVDRLYNDMKVDDLYLNFITSMDMNINE